MWHKNARQIRAKWSWNLGHFRNSLGWWWGTMAVGGWLEFQRVAKKNQWGTEMVERRQGIVEGAKN